MDEIVVLLDDAFEEIHTRQKIREILRTEEHIHIGDLPVDVDIAHALTERIALAVVVALGDLELLLVLLEAFERRIQFGAACLVLGDCRVRLLIQNSLLLGERVDLARKLIALPPEFLDLCVVAVALLLEGRCRSLPCGKEGHNERRRERLFHHSPHITPSGSA